MGGSAESAQFVRVWEFKFEVLPTAKLSLIRRWPPTRGATAGYRDGGQSQIVIRSSSVAGRDDVIAILPQVDCALLVTAVGISAVSEIDECHRYLQSTEIVKYVVNKAPQSSANYSYY